MRFDKHPCYLQPYWLREAGIPEKFISDWFANNAGHPHKGTRPGSGWGFRAEGHNVSLYRTNHDEGTDMEINDNAAATRYEGLDDRLVRVMENHNLLEKYPEGMEVMVLKSVLFGAYLKDAILFKSVNNNLSKKDAARIGALMEKYPGMQFTVGSSFDAVYYKAGDTYERHITPSTVLQPVGITIPGVFDRPLVFLQGETVLGNSDRYETDYLFYSKQDGLEKVAGLINAIVEIEDRLNSEGRRINIYGSEEGIELDQSSYSTWEDVFLSEQVKVAIKDDIEFFLNNRKVFEEVGIPYKRGYLLTGDPGNGKSSICRVLATSMPFESFMFDFSNPDMGNEQLTEAFKWATKVSPSVFFLEDIDRIFDPDTGPKTRVTMDHLLNCLDGIKVNTGLVVVATANNPKVLDSAILSRPGRFDKVVVVNAPDHTLRARYLKHLFRKLPTVTETDIGYMADETESMSMAFLKEVFVVTASRAIMAGEIVGRKHIDSALEEVQRQYGGVSKSNARKAGFGS